MRLLEQISKLSRDGYTFIKSTHSPEHALWIADRAVMIKDGKVMADGPCDEVVNDANLFRLYNARVKVVRAGDSFQFCVPEAIDLKEKRGSGAGGEEKKPLFALAGPPSGALINCETLVRPGILKMQGIQDVRHPTVQAQAADSIPRKMPKPFVRWTRLARCGADYTVTLNPPEGAGPLATMAGANSLTIIPQGVSVEAGDNIEVLPLDWMGTIAGAGCFSSLPG